MTDRKSRPKQRQLGRRSRLLALLDEHPDRTKLIQWLRVNGGQTWTKYLDVMEEQPIGVVEGT